MIPLYFPHLHDRCTLVPLGLQSPHFTLCQPIHTTVGPAVDFILTRALFSVSEAMIPMKILMTKLMKMTKMIETPRSSPPTLMKVSSGPLPPPCPSCRIFRTSHPFPLLYRVRLQPRSIRRGPGATRARSLQRPSRYRPPSHSRRLSRRSRCNPARNRPRQNRNHNSRNCNTCRSASSSNTRHIIMKWSVSHSTHDRSRPFPPTSRRDNTRARASGQRSHPA